MSDVFEKFRRRAIEKKLLFRNGRKNEGDFFTYCIGEDKVSGSYNITRILELIRLARIEFYLSKISEALLNLRAVKKTVENSPGEIIWKEPEKIKKKKNSPEYISLREYLIRREENNLQDEFRFILPETKRGGGYEEVRKKMA